MPRLHTDREILQIIYDTYAAECAREKGPTDPKGSKVYLPLRKRGARGGTRTRKPVKAADFESG